MLVLTLLLKPFKVIPIDLLTRKNPQSMRQSLLLLLSLLFLANCATIQNPEIHPGITLPASGDGYQIDTLTGAHIRTPAAQWQAKLPQGIILFSDDWEILKNTLLTDCMETTCAESVGALDSLFQIIDQSLQNLPSP